MFFLPLLAALPPLAQSTREMQAILTAPEIVYLLHSGETIEALRRIEGGYLLETNEHLLEVHIEYLPQEHRIAGPRGYKIEFVSFSLKV
jgi:hypothetical protein